MLQSPISDMEVEQTTNAYIPNQSGPLVLPRGFSTTRTSTALNTKTTRDGEKTHKMLHVRFAT